MRKLFALLVALVSIACGSEMPLSPPTQDILPPSAPPTLGPIVVNVVADAASSNDEVRSAFRLIETKFPDLVRFVYDGSGTRTISLRYDPAAMYESVHGGISGAWANPYRCTCTAEGEIAFGSLWAANHRPTVLHEIGHLFGLQHRNDGDGLMSGRPVARWPNDRANNAVQEWEEYSDLEWRFIEAALKTDNDASGR